MSAAMKRSKKQWRNSPAVQKRMRELGLKDEHALQSWFIQRIEKFLNAHGRRLIGWDEILEGGLAPNATVMSWRGVEGAIAAAAAGHDAVLAAAPTLYFDNRPLDTPRPPGRGPVVSVADVYRFDPAPAALTPAQREHILGVQANLWTEHIRTEESRRVHGVSARRGAGGDRLVAADRDRLGVLRAPAARAARALSSDLTYASPMSSRHPAVDRRRTSHQLQAVQREHRAVARG